MVPPRDGIRDAWTSGWFQAVDRPKAAVRSSTDRSQRELNPKTPRKRGSVSGPIIPDMIKANRVGHEPEAIRLCVVQAGRDLRRELTGGGRRSSIGLVTER